MYYRGGKIITFDAICNVFCQHGHEHLPHAVDLFDKLQKNMFSQGVFVFVIISKKWFGALYVISMQCSIVVIVALEASKRTFMAKG